MKKVIFGLIATIFMSVLSVNAQNQSIKIENLVPVDFGLGLVSPTIGDCIEAPSFCSRGTGRPIDLNTSFVAMSKTSENTIMIVFSDTFYQENKQNLAKGLVVGEPTAIQKELAVKLGFSKALKVSTGTYQVRKTDVGYTAEVRIK